MPFSFWCLFLIPYFDIFFTIIFAITSHVLTLCLSFRPPLCVLCRRAYFWVTLFKPLSSTACSLELRQSRHCPQKGLLMSAVLSWLSAVTNYIFLSFLSTSVTDIFYFIFIFLFFFFLCGLARILYNVEYAHVNFET